MKIYNMLLIAAVAVSSFQEALGNHPLHCSKWKGNCGKYKRHCSQSNISIPESCCEPFELVNEEEFMSGIYTLQTGPYSTSDAWCDMQTDGGGWLVIMRRSSVNTSFEKLFADYEDGFGHLSGDFWYGLRSIQALTSRGHYEMRIDMYNDQNNTESTSHAHYSSFALEGSQYILKLGDFSGSDERLMDNMLQFKDRIFIAKTEKLDVSNNCINTIRGGWWYAEHCTAGSNQTPGAILTRPYNELDWYDISIPTSPQVRNFEKYEMKIRKVNCTISGTT